MHFGEIPVAHLTLDEDEYLEHHGVKGMKWGVRKYQNEDGTLKPAGKRRQNENYTVQQRKRDRQIYGKRGERRINKALNEGDKISVARGDEKRRRDKLLNTNKYTRQTGKMAGAVAGGALGYGAVKAFKAIAFSKTTHDILDKMFAKTSMGTKIKVAKGLLNVREAASFVDGNPAIKIAVTTSMAKIGEMASGDIAVRTRMRAHGYDPDRTN